MSSLLRLAFRNATTRVLILVFGAGIFLVIYFLINSYFSLLGAYEEGELNKLKGIIYTLAPRISGDKHEWLTNTYHEKDDLKKAEDDSVYLGIQNQLKEVVESNMLPPDAIYTMMYDSVKSKFEFAVFSRGCYWLHEWEKFHPEHVNEYSRGTVVPTYTDENGTWLSAFVPIRNSAGKQVGIIQVDSRFDGFIARARKAILINSLITIAVVLVIGIFLMFSIRKLLLAEEKAAVQLREALQKVEASNRETLESIEYARRIQDAILPGTRRLSQVFPQSFVLYHPRDIVSGDFFWMAEENGWAYIAAVDCTGHGVPGAFMSIIGSTFLAEIAVSEERKTPSQILDQLEKKITAAMNKDGNFNRDGMDIGLAAVCLTTREVEFAGALRPMVITGSHELQEIRANRFPIGGGTDIPKSEFTNHKVQLNPGDSFYLFTDGYADQIGETTRKRIGTKRLKQELQFIAQKSPAEGKEHLEKFWHDWRGNTEQMDDVLLIGVRMS
ncbi:MAG: SpoIIE family protein phosphatase [Bacteroidia bacterium]|jgi:serine phosphatase RsbU (regulator of sigma subunit)|nr:SpoIIE family protein phosphatase [Bacteroidia bacterium]